MELAFWDPMTVGDLSAPLPDGLVADSTAGGEAMKAVGSMGFEEMLQWMETDPGKDDLASFSGTPIPWNSEGGATVPTPSDDFRAMLSHALTSPEDVNSAVSDSTHLSTTALSSSSAMFSGLMPSSEQQQFARVTAGSSMQFQRQRNLQYLPIMSQALGDNLEIDISSPFAGHMQQTNMHSISLPQQMPFALNPLEQHQQMMLQQAQIAQQQQHLHLQQLQLQQQMQGQQPLVSLFAPVDSSALQQQHAPAILDNLDFGQLDSPFLVHEQYLTAPRPTTTMMQILQHTPTNVTSSPAVSGERSQGSMPLMTDGDKSSHADLSFLEQQVDTQMAKENTHEDILVNTTPDFALQKLQGSADSSLYTQMLRIKASIRKVPQQHKGRASAKDRVHDLERQVAELQQQKSTLTEETENLQCRLNILERMLQLRRENCEEVTDSNVRAEEQIQIAELVRQTANLTTNDPVMKPHFKPLPEIFSKECSPAMMDEMGNSYQALVDRLSRVMQEVDKQPLGTDLSNTPLFPALEEELKSMQAFWSAVQTVGGGLLVYQWQLRCYNQIVANQSNFPEEFVLNCQKVYPLLRLTQQQKERIKMAFDVCSRRVKEMNDDRDEILKVISTLSLDDSLSMLERCREVVASDIALRSLRVYQENMKQCHVTFATIVLRKILDSIQIARLIITSYPLLPCVKTFARVVDTDLRNTTCATTTKLDAEEFIKICRPCGPKPVTFATFTA